MWTRSSISRTLYGLPPYSGMSESTIVTSAPSPSSRFARFDPMRQGPRRVVVVQELTRWLTSSPQHHLFVAPIPRLDELPDHRGDDMRVLEVEVVVRPVQVGEDRSA